MGVAVFFSYIIAKRHRKFNYSFLEYWVRGNREFGSYFQFLYDYNIGKQVRIYQMFPLIRERRKKRIREYTDASMEMTKAEVRLMVGADAASTILLWWQKRGCTRICGGPRHSIIRHRAAITS